MSTITTLIYLTFTDENIGMWEFLSLQDVLKLSTASKFFASLMITNQPMQKLVQRTPGLSLNIAGRFKVNLPRDLTLGMFRRTMNRVFNPSNDQAILYVCKSGKVVLDIGSALNDNDVHLASAQPLEESDEEENDEAHQIHRHIEVTSCDEYDDFIPRHPKAKGSHRRGDSYFNSDIDTHANTVLQKHVSDAFNMSEISSGLDADEPNPNAVKNRFLKLKSSMASNNYPGMTNEKY